MKSKAISKTGELLGWATANGATIDLIVKLWDLYVLRAVIYGAALATIQQHAKATWAFFNARQDA
jgi:hypothetical protein